jgi:RimJ/RimL family protein N-acetyltransferase
MSVEQATPSDIPAIMAVERMPGFEGLVGRFSHDEHEAEMAKQSVRYLVARDERGDVGGFALLQGVGDPDGRVHLKRIAVREVGRGTGSALLGATVAWLFSETDANRVDLDVFVENERARRAYEKAGFTIEGRLREYHRVADGSYRDMWLMSILRREWHS